MSQQPVIVVVAFNRPQALKGLLNSLLAAQYPIADVPLVIAIDGGGDPAVVAMAEAFQWPHGTKTIKKQPTQLGLKPHILACGRLTQEYGSIILLEDDLEVAEGFYPFAMDALATYGADDLVAGISLYSYATTEIDFSDFNAPSNSLDCYLMQFPSSWGQAWTAGQWQGFETWLGTNANPDFGKLPPFIQRWGKHSWKKLFALYLVATEKYFVYPKASFTTNKGYAGTHFAQNLTLFDVPFYSGPALTLDPIETLQRYDAQFKLIDVASVPSNQRRKTVEVAEYDRLVKKGMASDNIASKWWFVGRYKFHNYLKAIKRLLR